MPDQTATLNIPLFPLPNVVFFPKTFLPLHIFEPRYRAMVKDASEGDRLIGMVLLKEGWEPDYEGAPAVHRTGCAGKIIALESLPDGRYNLMLHGLCRFAIESESHVKLYREAQVRRPLESDWSRVSGEVLEALLQEVRAMIDRPTISRELSAMLRASGDPEQVVNLVSSELPFTEQEKQFLLDAETLEQQARRLVDLIRLRTAGL
ncbi:MAG TPA: LON peptidase substrate-binding domain-containing protein [Nitrospiria bacterium]|nr:LON peptidase substrate-binding domain-containing protein [Nitrospiria bacterium]